MQIMEFIEAGTGHQINNWIREGEGGEFVFNITFLDITIRSTKKSRKLYLRFRENIFETLKQEF
jgi:hypothetical protein